MYRWGVEPFPSVLGFSAKVQAGRRAAFHTPHSGNLCVFPREAQRSPITHFKLIW